MTQGASIRLTAPPEVYRRRRARLAEALRRPLAILAGRAPARNYAANTHPFRAGSTYLYFGGPPVEGAAWFIEPGSDGRNGCWLFRPPSSPDDACWFGETPSDSTLAEAAGADGTTVGDSEALTARPGAREAGFVCPPCHESLRWMEKVGLQPADSEELLAIIHQRLIKDEHEMAAMRRAAEVSMKAHRAAYASIRAGRREADVAAVFMAVLEAGECRPSFTPIITVRGEVLHGHGYGNVLHAGALLLVDAGAEEPGGYACDITRTYPVNGRWTPVQRHLYDTVLRAQKTAIAACVPPRRYRDIHDLAATVICEGLVQVELLRGDPADLAKRAAHTLFFCHGLGHLIGLDVHDMEDFGDLAGYAPGRTRRPEFGHKFLRLDRDLEAGMTVTVEPGIYLVPAIWSRDDLLAPFADVVNRRAVEALLADRFGGIRIEETVHIRADASAGPEVLTAMLPSDPDEVTAA